MRATDLSATDEAQAHLVERTSDQVLRLVEIIFGLVVAQSLLHYRDIWLHPSSPGNWMKILALCSIYLTTVFSWVDFHRSVEKNPYRMHLQPTALLRYLDYSRLFFDLAIVIAYTALLFSISEIPEDAEANLSSFLLGFTVIFLLYILSGIPRRIIYGKTASRTPLLSVVFALYLGVWVAYGKVFASERPNLSTWALNAIAILGATLIMLIYRIVNGRLRRNSTLDPATHDIEQPRLRIGIDIDGVLADQISGLIPRIKEKFNFDLRYEDVDEWNKKIGPSDFVTEIGLAFSDPAYILGMRVHDGAVSALDELLKLGLEIVCITNRPKQSEPATVRWLAEQRVPHWSLIRAKEAKKSEFGLDILVDDYVGNILDFLKETKGTAILVDQPWNRDRSKLGEYISQGRLSISHSWSETAGQVEALVMRHSNYS